MKASELFGVAVRIVGLVGLIYGIGSVGLLLGTGFWSFGFVMKQIVWLAVSIYLLRGAPFVVGFAYPGSDRPQ